MATNDGDGPLLDPKVREKFQTTSIMILILVIWTLLMLTFEDRRRINALERGVCEKALSGQGTVP